MITKQWVIYHTENGEVHAYNMPSLLTKQTPLAMFDLDNTLIFYNNDILLSLVDMVPLQIQDLTSVKLRYSNVIEVLNQYKNRGYAIFVLTNQGGVAIGKVTMEQIRVAKYRII